jgi:sugar O-acyltransferase (sialic acid O-acetyltransferase NeuD family)
MAKVIIFGAGRGALTAYKYLRFDTTHEIVAFTVNKEHIHAQTLEGIPIVAFENLEENFDPKIYQLFAPLGFDEMNKVRQRVFENGKAKGYNFISYVHSSNKTLLPIEIGENCFILENQSLNLDVKIGNNVVLWSGNQIGDRVMIEDHVWISSEVCISGNVTIGKNSILAVHCTISHDVHIAEENFIGANALMVKSTLAKEVYVEPPTPKAPFNSERFMLLLKRPS